MNRHQKESVVSQLRDKFSNSEATFLVGYKGLQVRQLENLRSELREKGGNLKVTKARLMKLSVEGMSGTEDLQPYFKDQVGLVFASRDAASVAKMLHDFSKKNEAFTLVVGCLENKVLNKDDVVRIASLPSREVLLGMACGAMIAPVRNLAVGMNAVMLKFAWALKKLEEQKQQ